mgnify:CR=1 FL=1
MPKLTASSAGLATVTTMTTTMFGTSFVCLAFMFSNSASFGFTTSTLTTTFFCTTTSHIIHKVEKRLFPLFFTRAVLFFTRASSSCCGLLRYLCNQLAGFQCFIYILLYYFFELWVVLAYNDLFKLCF